MQKDLKFNLHTKNWNLLEVPVFCFFLLRRIAGLTQQAIIPPMALNLQGAAGRPPTIGPFSAGYLLKPSGPAICFSCCGRTREPHPVIILIHRAGCLRKQRRGGPNIP
jgi:hypothetical protein